MRCDPRVGTDIPVEIHSHEFAGPLAARTRDLSVSGACIATASPFDFKSVRQITLLLPTTSVRVAVEGCWQREEPSGELVLTGLQFEDPSAQELDVLWDLVLDSGKQLARFFYEHSALGELGLEDALGLAQVTRYREVHAGQTLYRQGARNEGEDSICIILRGTVVLQVRVRDARDVEVARLHSGDVFGGLTLLARVGYSESAVAQSDVSLLEIDEPTFRYIRSAKPWLGYRLGNALLRIAVERFHALMGETRDTL